MKKRSFRSIITVMLVVVISTISYSAFHIYSHQLEKRIYSEFEKSIVEYSLDEFDGNHAFIRNSSLIFTVSMVFIIIAFVLFIHYRFVRRSLREFNDTIQDVNKGDLHSRLSIPETKELGKLGKNFNSMLDRFQVAQRELKEFHTKELRSNYKLATIGEMAARLAHEIRNPITGIANAIEIIVNDTNDPENLPILEEIQRQAKRVNDAISDLLKYSRKKDLDLSLYKINKVIKPVVSFLRNQLDNKEIKFELKLMDGIPPLRFDKKQMEDVLLNLGLNAIQAIQEKGMITFQTEFNSNESRLLIYVSDTGKGIPENELSTVFHPFFTTRSEGTGLGLAVVKDTIDKHRGEIWVVNNKGSGCTFTISLPVERE